MSSQDTVRLKVPRQELNQSSFFKTEEDAVDQWVKDLPMANIGQTTRLLFKALSELNHVRVLPAKRMAILEKLRIPIHYVSSSLSKHYLNQAIVLPEQPRKVADLTYALHNQLATGYTIVATHTAALGIRLGLSKPKDLLSLSLHRATTEYTLILQLRCQLYEPISDNIWHSLHQFYFLARQNKVLNKTVTDSLYAHSSIEGAYIRALLLGCSKPNELRQQDFKALFNPLSSWADHCTLGTDNNNALFIVDLNGDKPPIYTELYEAEKSNHCIYLDTTKLSRHLKQLFDSTTDDKLMLGDKDHRISVDLLSHLVLSWGSVSKRTFMRQEVTDTLELSVGLSATHHFVSGELSFEALVEERGAKTFSMQPENRFMKMQSNHQYRQKDVWDSPYEANVGQTQVSLESIDYHIRRNEAPSKQVAKRYRSKAVNMINSSAHGYCIEWPQDTQTHINSGEVVGIKEANTHNWSIAVIRWVSHQNPQQILIGLELISPTAAPYGARIIHKTGDQAEYTRALVLPEIPAINQPVTLLTPRVPFKVGSKVVLNQRAKEVQVILTNKVNTDGHYCQFEFKRIATPEMEIEENEDSPNENESLELIDEKDDFDSLWGKL